MSITSELEHLKREQLHLIAFCKYLEKNGNGRYDDLFIKVSQVVGNIEEVLNFDEH